MTIKPGEAFKEYAAAHPDEIRREDALDKQGIFDAATIQGKLGDLATPDKAGVISEPSPVVQTDLFDYYGQQPGPEFNPKNGELGKGWFQPTPQQDATNRAGFKRIRDSRKKPN